MKKRMVCLLLFLGLLCTGCQSGGALSDGEETTSPQETTSPPAETTTSSLTHQDIVPVKAETCEMRAFRNGTLRRVLGMPLPKSWEFQKDLSLGWEIVRNGTRIGTMGTDNFETEGWVLVQSQSLERSGVRLEICIERNDTTAPTAFRYRLEMEYDHLDQILHSTMTVDYAEMAEFTLTKIKGNIGIVELSTDPALGTVPLPASRRSILILGNSFVGTSQVGSVLQEMVQRNGRDLQVEAVSRGMASVATYGEDSTMLTRIRNGGYGAVFLCGFYSASSVEALAPIAEACRTSGTRLVIFPAHNEHADSAAEASIRYSLPLLNWKGDLDALIANGVDRWDLCINDYYSHSTPLAGYVGAHMIYRAVFGAIPSTSPTNTVSQGQIALLGDYSLRGSVPVLTEEQIVS